MDRICVEVATDSAVYLPSQPIHGSVNISCPYPVAVDSVEARLIGVATVSFTSKEYYQFINRRVFVDQSKELWHYESIQGMLDMPIDENSNKSSGARLSGRASFPFSFQLPSSVATSFSCSGSPVTIKYTVEVRLLNATKLLVCHEHSLIVLSPEKVPRLSIQQKSTHSKHYKFPKERGIYLECVLDRTVFTTTDRVEARLTIVNRWKQSIKYVHMSIVRRISAEGILVDDKNVAHTHVVHIDTTGVGLPPSKPKICVGESYCFLPCFNVPALSPTMSVEGIMTADYLLRIAIGRAHNYVVATLKVPITIVTDFMDSPQPSIMHSQEMLIDVSPIVESMARPQLVDLLA